MTNAEQRERDFPLLNREGVCHITEVIREVFEPAVAKIETSLGEHLLVFREAIASDLEHARREHRLVWMELKPTNSHKRYVAKVRLLPAGEERSWPCYKCGTLANREIREYVSLYTCPHCHQTMEIPR